MIDLLDDEIGANAPVSKKDVLIANAQRMAINERLTVIRNGRSALIVLVVINVLAVVVGLMSKQVEAIYVLIEGVIVIGVYLLSIFVMHQNHKKGLLLGLGFFIFMLVLYLYVNPEVAMKGFIIKGAVIYYIGKALAEVNDLTQLVEKAKVQGVLSSNDLININQMKDLLRLPIPKE